RPTRADDRCAGGTEDRPVPRPLLLVAAERARARPPPRLPGPRPGLPVSRRPLHEADLRRRLDRSERCARVLARGVPLARRRPADAPRDPGVPGLPDARAGLLAHGRRRAARRSLETRIREGAA